MKNPINIPIEYDFKKYAEPKIGLFSVEKFPAEYILPGGWVQDQVKVKIIGETDDCFIEKLKLCEHGEWIGDIVVKEKYILPLGIHKSRLIKWINVQLSLFDDYC